MFPPASSWRAPKSASLKNVLRLRTFNNLINGQVSWRERELAEMHVRDCFYCLDRFTAYQEMIRIRKDIQPLPEPEVNATLSRLACRRQSPRASSHGCWPSKRAWSPRLLSPIC